jgi:hypothetical protein
LRDWKNVPQRDNYPDHAKNSEKLKPEDAVCFFQARQTICASHLARKSGQLTGASEMQKWCDQIDTGKFNPNNSDDSPVISIPTSAVPPAEPHIGTVSIVSAPLLD